VYDTGVRSRVRRLVRQKLADEEWRACRRWVTDALIADALASPSASVPAVRSVPIFDEPLWNQRFEYCPVPAGRQQALLEKLGEIVSVGRARPS
jgi:hypothetical protein